MRTEMMMAEGVYRLYIEILQLTKIEGNSIALAIALNCLVDP